MKRIQILTPLIFAIAPVLFFYATKEMDVQPPHVVVAPMVVTIALALFCWAISWVCVRDVAKATLISCGFIVAFFSPAVALVVLMALLGGSGNAALLNWGSVILSAAVVGTFVWLAQSKFAAKALGIAFNVGILVLLVQVVIVGAFIGATFLTQLPAIRAQVKPPDAVGGSHAKTGSVHPDIYFILLDGCSSPETARTKFGYDNSAFVANLEKLGFIFHSNSFCNYPMTEMSLCATLNLCYLNNATDVVGKKAKTMGAIYWLIQDNDLIKLCHANGYRFVNVTGRFGPTDWMPTAQNMVTGYLDMFAYEFFEFTALAFLDRALGIYGLERYYIWCFENQFADLQKVASNSNPKVVFAHVLMPHPPYVLDEVGKMIPTPSVTFSWTEGGEPGYIQQTKFIETKMEEVVAGILSSYPDAAHQPVILIQSDHGPAFGPKVGTVHDPAFLYHRQRILNAMLLPKELRNQVPLEFSPVNNFRFLFGSLLGCDLPLLPNRSYYCDYSSPYDLTDATNAVRKARSQ